MKTTNDIVPDEQIERVHAYANFGDMSKRAVVDRGVLNHAFGYSSGSTMLAILREHGLISKSRDGCYAALTKKGFRYLQAMFYHVGLARIEQLRENTK